MYPHLSERMASSRDYDELTYVWNEWRRVTAPVKEIYEQFVQLSNKGARQGITYNLHERIGTIICFTSLQRHCVGLTTQVTEGSARYS